MKVNNRESILNILKNNSEFISGEEISRNLGISRTAVWKNIKILIEEGYNISVNPSGYKFIHNKEIVTPYEFPGESELFYCNNESDSTMSIARELILHKKNKPWTIIISRKQSNGRNKSGSLFESPEGGLYFSIIPEIKGTIMDINLYPMAALNSLYSALIIENVKNIYCKWPFEIWTNSKKIAGIIHDFEIESNTIKWMIIGVGVYIDDKLSKLNIIQNFKKGLLEEIGSKQQILTNYTKNISLIGRDTSFIINNRKIRGEVKYIDNLGTLSVETNSSMEFGYIGNSYQED